MQKLALVSVITLTLSGGAIAQTEFYVVQDVKTKKCTIVDQRPTTKTTTVVSNGVFKTRTEAETGMKSIKVCTSN